VSASARELPRETFSPLTGLARVGSRSVIFGLHCCRDEPVKAVAKVGLAESRIMALRIHFSLHIIPTLPRVISRSHHVDTQKRSMMC
jgi:hypothetical protein